VQGQHELNPALFYAKPTAPFVVRPIRADLRIIGLKLYPGYTASLIRQVLDMPLDAVVLESYGAGNAPDTDPALLEAFAAATRRGVAIVNVSQCLSGRVSMETYATGVALARAGLISGRDMTPEAALAKLYFLLSSPDALLGVEDRVPVSLRGELSAG
jgi:L-asparaginase